MHERQRKRKELEGDITFSNLFPVAFFLNDGSHSDLYHFFLKRFFSSSFNFLPLRNRPLMKLEWLIIMLLALSFARTSDIPEHERQREECEREISEYMRQREEYEKIREEGERQIREAEATYVILQTACCAFGDRSPATCGVYHEGFRDTYVLKHGAACVHGSWALNVDSYGYSTTNYKICTCSHSCALDHRQRYSAYVI